ncbi:MAG: Rqc2 family fibronectin-binding protein [Saccharofermentanales bacterium]
MPLDGVTSYFLSRELDAELSGGRVEKINQPYAGDLHLRIRKERETFTLLLSANPSEPRIYISSEIFKNPPIPYRFCTILRKYLTGSRILSITSPAFERIFIITFQTVNELGDLSTMSLVAEIMGRHSNIIFLNENGRIMDAMYHIDNSTSRVREVLPARQYVLPPVQDKLSLEDALTAFRSGEIYADTKPVQISKFIVGSISGISPLLANEICFMAGIDPADSVPQLSSDARMKLAAALASLVDLIQGGRIDPSLMFLDAASTVPYDFHAYPISSFQRIVHFESLSQAMDDFYRFKNASSSLQQKKNHLLKLAGKKLQNIENKIAVHRQDLSECDNHEQFKVFGELIYSNIYLLKGGEKSMTVIDYNESSTPEIEIPLNENSTPSQNAQKYFKKYAKLKSKSETVSVMLANELSQEEYLESVMIAIANAESEEDINALKYEFSKVLLLSESFDKTVETTKKKPKSGQSGSRLTAPAEPRRFLSSDGMEILIGRNSLQNEYLSFSVASREDIWLHVQKAPGTHTIIRSGKNTPPDKTIEEAAMLTAWYSRKSEARDTKTVVDYCAVADVKKQKNSTPGHVLYKNFHSITVYARIPESIRSQVE